MITGGETVRPAQPGTAPAGFLTSEMTTCLILNRSRGEVTGIMMTTPEEVKNNPVATINECSAAQVSAEERSQSVNCSTQFVCSDCLAEVGVDEAGPPSKVCRKVVVKSCERNARQQETGWNQHNELDPGQR